MKTKIALVLLALTAMMACKGTVTPPEPNVPIMISNPSDGATLNDRVTITATPGQGFTFTHVNFFIDSVMVLDDSISPFQYDWNIFALQSGTNHTIYVTGFTADSTFTSPLVNVRVEFTRGFTFVSTYRPGSQHAIGVTDFYNVLFVSTGAEGLEVIDITNKAVPRFRSRLVLSGQALHSTVRFPYVYVAELNQVDMANFENVDSLIPLTLYQTQSLVRDVATTDHFVLSVENDGLSILSPFSLQAYSRLAITQDQLNYAVARHDTAFVVGNSTFYIVDCTNPTAPDIVSTYDNLNLATSVAVADTFAFIANGSGGVMALSIARPTNPVFLARYNPGQIITSVDTGAGVLFAGSNSSMVYALDYSTPDSLIVIDNMTVSNQVKEIKFNSNYLYVAANTDVNILRFIP